MIRSVAPAAVTPTCVADDAVVQAPTARLPDVAAAAWNGSGEAPRSRLGDLFGPPPGMHRFYADKDGAGSGATAKTDPLVGAAIPGQKGVVVQRTFGDPSGYDTKNHAIAWARAAGSERAMVVLGQDKRWHAVETNATAKDASGGNGAVATAIQVGKVDPAQYDRLKAAALKANDPAAWKTFAAYALGIPESEVNVMRQGDAPSSTQVNINLSPDFDPEGRTANFEPHKAPSIELGPKAFNRPANAVSTLAHEEVHADHVRLTQPYYARYEAAPHGHQSFREWAAKNIKDTRTADIVAGEWDRTFGATELEAHVEAAKVSFASGDLDQARTDLQKVSNRPVLPLLKTQLVSIEALKKMRDGLPADARAVFDEVAKKAKSPSVLHGL
jgi:hypothetical protein